MSASQQIDTRSIGQTRLPWYSAIAASEVAPGLNLAAILGVATGPYNVTWLVQHTGNPLAPAFHIMVVAAAGGATLATVTETARKPLAA